MQLTFRWQYLFCTILLFLTEIFIAMFVHDNFIRPYFGDFLVVVLVYFFLKTFIHTSNSYSLALYSLFFAYFIEALQWLNFIKISGLDKFKLARIVLGNTISWDDIAAYSAGIGFILFLEWIFKRNFGAPLFN